VVSRRFQNVLALEIPKVLLERLPQRPPTSNSRPSADDCLRPLDRAGLQANEVVAFPSPCRLMERATTLGRSEKSINRPRPSPRRPVKFAMMVCATIPLSAGPGLHNHELLRAH
jgi:hypothetical protein